MFKKLLIAVVIFGCLGLAGFGVLAWEPAIAPIVAPPAGSFAPELVAMGEALAGGGYCAACHTAKGETEALHRIPIDQCSSPYRYDQVIR